MNIQSIGIFLPFPPSVNGLYAGKERRYKSDGYKKWLGKCPTLSQYKIDYKIKIIYTFTWPCKRLRDGQNYMKPTLDYLVSEGVILDDNYDIVVSETWKHLGIDKEAAGVLIEIQRV